MVGVRRRETDKTLSFFFILYDKVVLPNLKISSEVSLC